MEQIVTKGKLKPDKDRKKKNSVVQVFQNRKLEKMNPFFLEDFFLLGEGHPFYISLFSLAEVDFQSLLGKIQSHIFKILVDIIGYDLKDLISLLGIKLLSRFLLLSVIIFPDGECGEGFVNLVIVTNGAADDAAGSLLLKRVAVREPAFEFVPVGTDEVKSDHRERNPLSYLIQYSGLLFQTLTCNPDFGKPQRMPIT